MPKYKIFLLFLLIFPNIAYADFLSNFNQTLKNLGQNINKNVNQLIQKKTAPQYIQVIPDESDEEEFKPTEPAVKSSSALKIESKSKITEQKPITKKQIAIIGDWQAFYLGNYLKIIYEKNDYLNFFNIANGCQDIEAKSCYGASLEIQNQEQLNSELQALKAITPDLLIIFLGANDTNISNIQAQNFINQVKLYAKHIIWLSTPPFKINPKTKYLEGYLNLQANNTNIENNNAIIKNVAEQNNLIYINFWQDFLSNYNLNQNLLTPDTIGFTNTALTIIAEKLQPALQELSNEAKNDYNPNKNFSIILKEPYQSKIYNINETLDHSPILLGGALENRESAILKPQFNAWPPKARADYMGTL